VKIGMVVRGLNNSQPSSRHCIHCALGLAPPQQ